MGRKRQRGRNVNGILLLDKSVGMSSNAALQEVKKLFYAKKAGHTGSLDPLASGLLPLCLGEATKLSSFLLDSDKVYEGVCQLGKKTSTGDAEGDVIQERPVPEFDEATIKKVFSQFMGDIEQIPPMHSAIKQNGQPLYKLAHQGIVVEREPRQVHIYELDYLSHDEKSFRFRLRCSKGTYVRTLVEDMGEVMGCGAHLTDLRRTQVGPFDLEHAVTPEVIAHVAADGGYEELDKLMIPMDQALENWPAVRLSENSTYYVRQGQPVQVAKAPTSGWVRLFANNDNFIGVGQIMDDGRVAPKRLVNVG